MPANPKVVRALHTLLTGESDGYYADFGKTEHLVRALTDGFVYSGLYPSTLGPKALVLFHAD